MCAEMAEGNDVALQVISEANSYFTLDLYKVLGEQPGNLFFSPISIQIALALVFLGARGNTAKEISKGLHLPEDADLIEDGANAVMNQLKDSTDVMLAIANKIFLKERYAIKDMFKQSAEKFLAGVEEVDFLKEKETRKIINDWVEGKTNHKIKDIIPRGILNGLTRMVLVNAIYFKGEWVKQFEKSNTKRMLFHSDTAPGKEVEMMFTKDKFMYTELKELNSKALLLRYKGLRISMMVILPMEVNGLAEAEKKLPNVKFGDIQERMTEEEVEVHLPKFKLEYEKQLTDSLIALGMKSMFDEDAANFTGISDERLFVSQVLHKAFIEVNEEGTEAAAATAVHLPRSRAGLQLQRRPIIFKADHPFIFFLLDNRTKAVLFAGRFTTTPA